VAANAIKDFEVVKVGVKSRCVKTVLNGEARSNGQCVGAPSFLVSTCHQPHTPGMEALLSKTNLEAQPMAFTAIGVQPL
jgi:hypothetical protein